MNRRNTLWDHGTHCVSLLLLCLANTPFIPYDLRMKLTPLILGAMVINILVTSYLDSKRSKEEDERERRDERSRMIYEKAVWYSSSAEDWGLLVLFTVFALGFRQAAIAYTMMWILVGRYALTFCIRWWLNRKY